MWLVRLVPFPIGVVSWQRPQRALTAVAKVTYALSRDGALIPSRMQLPLAGQTAGMFPGGAAVEQPSDFVPQKARCDVSVVGHAHAATPTRRHDVSIELGGWRKDTVLESDVDASRFPLSDDGIRCHGGVAALAPRRVDVPDWRERQLPRDFDFSGFNAAPSDQRLSVLAPGETLVLRGLLAAAPTRRLELPIEEPVVYFIPSPGQPARAIPLRCDTLWIHSDQQLCCMVWRGTIDLTDDTADAALLVASGPGAACDWPTIEAQLDSMPRERPVREPSESPAGSVEPTARLRSDTPHILRGQTGEVAVARRDRALPFRAPSGAASLPPSLQRALEGADSQAGGTLVFDRDDLLDADEPLPFVERPSSPESDGLSNDEEDDGDAAPETARRGVQLGSGGLGAQLGGVVLSSTSSGTEALPFASTPGPTGARGRHDDDGALPFQSSHAAAPSAASDAKPIGTETAALDSGSLLAAAAALPFARPREQLPFPVVAPAIVPVRPPDPLEQRRPAATAEPSPEPAVRAAASPPLAREPELSLALYARVRVALLDDRRGLPAALRGSGVEERRYLLHDRRMTIALAHEESEGKSELRRELEQAMADARSARAEPQPPHEMTVREYAELRAEVEEAREPARALSDLGLSKGAYAALRRRWTKRCLLDPQLAAELRDALQTARRSLRRVDDSNVAED